MASEKQVGQFCVGLIIGLSVSGLVFLQVDVMSRYVRSLEGLSTGNIGQGTQRMLTKVMKDANSSNAISNSSNCIYDDSVARILEQEVQITCVVMTQYMNLVSHATVIANTWGKRCTNIVFSRPMWDKTDGTNQTFFTLQEFRNFTVVVSGRRTLQYSKGTVTSLTALEYAYNTFAKSDWFVQTQDTTYVILENLRYFLAGMPKNKPVIYGSYIDEGQGEVALDAGIVFSRTALGRILEGRKTKRCPDGYEYLGAFLKHCMKATTLHIKEPLDELGRSLFHSNRIEQYSKYCHPDKNTWSPAMKQYCGEISQEGKRFPSDFAISFYSHEASYLQVMEFYVYHLHPYGVHWRYSIPDKAT